MKKTLALLSEWCRECQEPTVWHRARNLADAATNRDLEEMVAAQTFRSDLFHRLNVFPVRVPPLRERPDDIPLLVRHFVRQFSRRAERRIETISSVTMNALVQYHWPGNVRELQNIIERAVIVSQGSVLRVPTADLKPRPVEKSRAQNPWPCHHRAPRRRSTKRSGSGFWLRSSARTGLLPDPTAPRRCCR